MAKKRQWPTASATTTQMSGGGRRLFQVKFKSGQGQQVPAESAAEARAMMVAHYGVAYEIESVEEIAKTD